MKTIIKAKISLTNDGKILIIFIWKPYFKMFLPTIFGYWDFHKGTHCDDGFNKDLIKSINEITVSDILYKNLMYKF